MVITIRVGGRKPVLLTALVWLPALLLPAPQAGATAWLVTPSVRLRESYTDNANLAPAGQQQSDLVTELAPAVTLTGRGPRLTLDLRYALHQVQHTRGGNGLDHSLAAAAHLIVAEDWFYVDGRSAITLRNVSAFGPQADDYTVRSDNQRTVRSTSISPYLRHRFPGLVSAGLRYTHEAVSSGALFDSRSDQLRADISGDSDGRGLGWELSGSRSRSTDSASAETVTASRTELALHYPLGHAWMAFANGGYENQGYTSTSAAPQGRFWMAGLGWQPTPRSSLTVSAGRRFFGSTYALSASQHSRRALWTLSYNESISNTRADLLHLSDQDSATLLDQLLRDRIPDQQVRQQRIQNFLLYSQSLGGDAAVINYFSHRYYLQRQWLATVAAVGRRSTLVLTGTMSRRTAQTASTIDSTLLGVANLALQDSTRQAGASAGWNWQLTAGSSLNLGASRTTIDALATGRSDRNTTLNAGLSRTLQSRLTGSVELSLNQHHSNTGANYRERRISAALNWQL